MKRLENGAYEIARSIRVADYATFILAMWEKNGGTEYITWRLDAGGGYSHGHYFTDIIAAVLSLAERADKATLSSITPEMMKLATKMARDYQDTDGNGIDQDEAYNLATLVIKGGK